jgi:hypothetical protein
MAGMVKAKSSGRPDESASAQLEHWEYGDPQKVPEHRQEKSCHGCVHEAAIYFAENSLSWEIVKYCGKGRRHGKRCGLYQRERSLK